MCFLFEHRARKKTDGLHSANLHLTTALSTIMQITGSKEPLMDWWGSSRPEKRADVRLTIHQAQKSVEKATCKGY